MPPIPSPPDAIPAADLERLVEAARVHLRSVRLLIACAIALAATVGLVLAVVAADMLLPLSVALRVAAFAGLICMLAAAVAVVAWSWLGAPGSDAVARRIEALVPAMHNRLITVLDLCDPASPPASPPSPPASHPLDTPSPPASHPLDTPFAALLIDQTRRRLAPFRPHHLTDPRCLPRATAGAAASLALAAAMLLLFSSRMPTALARILAPTADIAPITGLAFRAQPGDFDVLQGEPVTLAATLERGETDSLFLQLRAADGDEDDPATNLGADRPWHRYPMQRQPDGRFTFALTALDRTYEYRITGGNTWSPLYRVNMVRRPVIEQVRAFIHLPHYMGIDAPLDAGSGPVVAPLGAEVQFIATARGEASTAAIEIITPAAAATDRGEEVESVWFDDAVPADAQLIDDWRWFTDLAYSGSKSHGFVASASAFSHGFRTRLSPLVLTPGSSFFTYARFERRDPRQTVTITLGDGPTSYKLVWGGRPTSGVWVSGPVTIFTVSAGPIPAAVGQWTRLEVPRSSIGITPEAPLKITKITFDINGGPVLFDRAGVLTRRAPAAAATKPHTDRTIAMTRGEAGRWSGRVPVSGDTHIAIGLHNAQGHASPAMTPVLVEARADSPPWLHVEKPGRSVTLSEVQPVPIAVRAFDDYGLAAVGLQVSRDVNAFTGAVKWIESWDEPLATRLVVAAIDPVDDQGRAVAMGESFFCRAVARDRKGQVSHGEAIRIAFIRDAGTPAPKAADRSAQLASLQEQLREYAAKQRQLSAEAAAQLASERGADGEALRELDARLAKQRLAAGQLTRQLDDQAAEAQRSPLASALEDDVLRLLADQMRELGQPPQSLEATEAAMMERLRQLKETSPGEQEQLAEMLRQLKSLAAAREQMAASPKQAQQSFEALLAQLQAQGATRELAQLAAALEQRRQAMAVMQKQQAELTERAAAQKRPEQVGGEQKKLDEQAIPALEKAGDLLRQQASQKEKLEPWKPGEPGEPGEPGAPAPQTDGNEEPKRAAEHEALKVHQQALARQLSQSRGELSSAKEQAMQLAESLRRATSKDDKSELQTMLASAAMKSMMNMAGRARSQAIEAAQHAGGSTSPEQPGRASGQQNTPNLRRGEVLPAGTQHLDPAAAAALYRLPPQLREALLSGMNEKGPAGYQRLIDAYYRELTEGMK